MILDFRLFMWFFIALIGYFFLAVVFVLDKLILTKSMPNPAVYTFYSTIFLLGVLLAWPFGVQVLHGTDWILATLSGLTFGCGIWAMFVAVKYSEASHINPFIGGAVTLATFGFSSLFLDEVLTSLQIVGIGVLIFTSLLLSKEKTRKKREIRVGYAWGVVAALCFALSHVLAKYIYDVYPFLTGIVWTKATAGIVGLFLLCYPCVWRSLTKKRTQKKQQGVTKHSLLIVLVDKILGIVGVVAIQYAIAIGSVTLVSAMSGIQFVFMFVLILLSTKWWRGFFQEYFTRREIILQTVAIFLVVLGSAFFVL